MFESTNVYVSFEEDTIVLEHGSRGATGATGPTGPTGPATTNATLLTTGTLNTARLPATGIFTTAVQAKATDSTYPGAQVAATGKIWSQPSKFAPFTGKHETGSVGYGSDTQVYIERSALTSSILTVQMNRAFALDLEQVLITSGSFPASAATITLADTSSFPNTSGTGFLSYEQISDPLTTVGALSVSWTDRTPYTSPSPAFAVGSTGAYCTRADGPSIATVSTGENNHDVSCQLSGTLAANQGIVVRYNQIGAVAASWVTLRYSTVLGKIEIYTHSRSAAGVITGTFKGLSDAYFYSGMYVRAVASDDELVLYTGQVNDSGEVEYSNLQVFTLSGQFLTGTNAGIYNFSAASTAPLYSDFVVRASKTFTYTGKSGLTLTGVTCNTAKTFTVIGSNPATYMKYFDTTPINLIRVVDSVGAVILRVKSAGGQHTTDNITMGAGDDAGDIGLSFQSDAQRYGAGLVFFGDSAPSGTTSASGSRGTFLRRVADRLLRMGGRLHIAPSDITNFAGTATGDGTAAEPHLGIGNVDTGLYLTTASSVDTLNVAVDGANVASFTSTGVTASTFTGTLTGNATTATTVVTNANLTGDVTSVGNATTLTNAPVIAKTLTGFTSGAGTITSSDSLLTAIQKLNGNIAPLPRGLMAAPTTSTTSDTFTTTEKIMLSYTFSAVANRSYLLTFIEPVLTGSATAAFYRFHDGTLAGTTLNNYTIQVTSASFSMVNMTCVYTPTTSSTFTLVVGARAGSGTVTASRASTSIAQLYVLDIGAL